MHILVENSGLKKQLLNGRIIKSDTIQIRKLSR